MKPKPKRPFAKAPKRKPRPDWKRAYLSVCDALTNRISELATAEADKRILAQANLKSHRMLDAVCRALEIAEKSVWDTKWGKFTVCAERDALAQKNLNQECIIIGLKGALELAGKELAKYKPDRTMNMMQYSESKDSKKI